MKDIEKLRATLLAEVEEKINQAIFENSIENSMPELNMNNISVHSGRYTFNNVNYITFGKEKGLSETDVALILCKFPSTKKFNVHRGKLGKELTNYNLVVHRGVRDINTTLEITWIWNNYECSINFPVTLDCSIGNNFKSVTRELTDIEINTYGIQKTRHNVDFRKCFPFLSFAHGNIVRYQGGRHQLISDDIAEDIINQLKELYNK